MNTDTEKAKNTLTFQDLIVRAEANIEAKEKAAKQVAGGLYLLAAAPMLIWRAFVLQFVWLWFVQPIFGIAVPSLALLIGLDIFVSAYKSSRSSMTSGEIYRALANGITHPMFIFIFAWITHIFV